MAVSPIILRDPLKKLMKNNPPFPVDDICPLVKLSPKIIVPDPVRLVLEDLILKANTLGLNSGKSKDNPS